MEPIRRVRDLAARQQGVATRRQALAAGMTRHQIDRLLSAGDLERVYNGVYRVAGSPRTWKQCVMAACLSGGPAAAASHLTAARLWDLPVEGTPAIEVVVPSRAGRRLQGFVVHWAALTPAESGRLGGIPVTSPIRTLVDVAGSVDPIVLEDLLDDAAGRKLVSLPKLDAYLSRIGRQGRAGAGTLQALLSERLHVQRVQQSRLERDMSRLVRRFGLPAPTPQYPVELPDGGTIFFDFAWPAAMFALETDSYRFHSTLTAWSRDRTRNNEAVIQGWRLMCATADDLRHRQAEVADQIRRGCAPIPALAG